jgi:hypothetical protein
MIYKCPDDIYRDIQLDLQIGPIFKRHIQRYMPKKLQKVGDQPTSARRVACKRIYNCFKSLQ